MAVVVVVDVDVDDILALSILIGGCVFLFAKLMFAAILPRVYTHIAQA